MPKIQSRVYPMLTLAPFLTPVWSLSAITWQQAGDRAGQIISKWGQAHRGAVSPLPPSCTNIFPGSSAGDHRSP